MDDASDWISLGALLVAAVGFAIGLAQYRKAQSWKVAEFVANEFKGFESDPVVRNALTLMDWTAIELTLEVDSDKAEKYRITHDDIEVALRPHPDVPGGFTPLSGSIRQTFDVFLSKLGRFNHYIKAGLVTRSDLGPYLDYWMDALCGRGKILKQQTCEEMWKFIVFYDYRMSRNFSDDTDAK